MSTGGEDKTMDFSKYEGLGNDLVFFAGREDKLLGAVDDRTAWMARVCDRHLGVGGDGLMFVAPHPDGDKTARIAYYNADGSPAEMCGNGLRCACLFLLHRGAVATGAWFTVEMGGAGLRRCRIEEAYGHEAVVEVEIGSPERGRGAEGEPERLALTVAGREVDLVPLSVSNPHAVTFQDLDQSDREALGPAIERDAHFPDRVNVEFARVAPDGGLDLVVWERGCGFTQACGSGACAAAVAAIWEGHVEAGRPVAVNLPGGTLHVRLDERDVIWLRGAARRAFEGTLDPDNYR
jgi:diaminopimelate epimerase